MTLCLMFETNEGTSQAPRHNQLTSIFGLRELLYLQLKVGIIWEAIKMLYQDPGFSLYHDLFFGSSCECLEPKSKKNK